MLKILLILIIGNISILAMEQKYISTAIEQKYISTCRDWDCEFFPRDIFEAASKHLTKEITNFAIGQENNKFHLISFGSGNLGFDLKLLKNLKNYYMRCLEKETEVTKNTFEGEIYIHFCDLDYDTYQDKPKKLDSELKNLFNKEFWLKVKTEFHVNIAQVEHLKNKKNSFLYAYDSVSEKTKKELETWKNFCLFLPAYLENETYQKATKRHSQQDGELDFTILYHTHNTIGELIPPLDESFFSNDSDE